MTKVLAKIIVSGVVQGVNYRWTVKRIADKHGIKGYVKNLADRNVEVIAEEEKEKVEKFIEAIKVRNGFIDVRNAKVEYKKPENKYKDFFIEKRDFKNYL